MKTSFFILVIFGLIIAPGCKTTIVEPTSKKPFPFIVPSSWANGNYSFMLGACKSVQKHLGGATIVENYTEFHVFDSTADGDTIVGVAKLNNTTLRTVQVGDGEYYKLTSLRGESVPLTFDGSNHQFYVQGSSNFSGINESLASPLGEMIVTSPTMATSLSKSAGFTVNWTVPSGSTSTIVLQAWDGSTPGYIERVLPDNGSYTFTPSELLIFATGDFTIKINRINYTEGTTPNGKSYGIAIGSQVILNTALNP